MESTNAVAVAAIAFVGSHFLLSHPLRGGLVRASGERGFLGVYTLVAFLTLGWLIVAYRKARRRNGGRGSLWAIATALMLIASIL